MISFSLFSATLSLKSSIGSSTMSSRVKPQPAGTKSSALCRLFRGLSEFASATGVDDSGIAEAWAGKGSRAACICLTGGCVL